MDRQITSRVRDALVIAAPPSLLCLLAFKVYIYWAVGSFMLVFLALAWCNRKSIFIASGIVFALSPVSALGSALLLLFYALTTNFDDSPIDVGNVYNDGYVDEGLVSPGTIQFTIASFGPIGVDPDD